MTEMMARETNLGRESYRVLELTSVLTFHSGKYLNNKDKWRISHYLRQIAKVQDSLCGTLGKDLVANKESSIIHWKFLTKDSYILK